MFNFEMETAASDPRTVYWHDQMFVAVHREASQLIFPLDAELDMVDAMISQWNMSVMASLLFRGHILLYKGLQVRNPLHGRDPDQQVQFQMESVSAKIRG